MFRRNAQRLAACTPMLQAIINGTASSGWKIRSRMAPATAEKAKPARPETKAPANTAALSIRFVARSGIGLTRVALWGGFRAKQYRFAQRKRVKQKYSAAVPIHSEPIMH